MSFLICILHNRREFHNNSYFYQEHREVDFEVKNLLIDLVRQHPAIYDKSHPDHFLTNLRNEIWDEIGKILSIPGKLNCHLI